MARSIASLLALVVILGGAFVVWAGSAPTGTYTATMGASGGTASAGAAGRGRGRAGRGTEATTGTAVTMKIGSYSSQAELDALAAAGGDPAKFLSVLSGYNHGTVTVGGQSFPINAAYSTSAGSAGNVICMATAKPLASSGTSRRGRQATGTSGGYIRLTVDASGSGTGMLYTSTQVVISSSGEFSARAGGSTGTALTDVSR